jgi:archaellum biogenesis protein FlaJ (TadC family)
LGLSCIIYRQDSAREKEIPMKRNRKVALIVGVLAIVAVVVIVLLFFVVNPSAVQTEPAQPFSIAVFVPGVVAGSPIYEQMVEGTERAVAEHDNASGLIKPSGKRR